MAKDLIHTRIVSLASAVGQGDFEMVSLPGSLGMISLLPHRAPLMVALSYGVVAGYRDRYASPDSDARFFISGGVAEVKNNVCVILAPEAMRCNETDRTEIGSRLAEAKDALDKAEDAAHKESLAQKIGFFEMILDQLEKDNPRPIVQPRRGSN